MAQGAKRKSGKSVQNNEPAAQADAVENAAADSATVSSIQELNRAIELVRSGRISGEDAFRHIAEAARRVSGTVQKSGNSSLGSLESSNISKPLDKSAPETPSAKAKNGEPKDELGTSLEQFRKSLDQIKAAIDASPALRGELQAHELFSDIASMVQGGEKRDPVVEEILRNLPVSWEDRKRPENKHQPWAKNASTYISHFMGKWIETGQLEQGHIKAVSERLYKAYTGLIAYSPQWDLGLPKREHVRLDNPTEAITRVREKSKLRQKKLTNT